MNFLQATFLRNAFKFAIFAILLGAILAISQTTLALGNRFVQTALLLDLLLTVPGVYYLLIRNSSIPRFTVVPVVMGALLVSLYVLPHGLVTLGTASTLVIAGAELAVLSFVLFRIARIRSHFLGTGDSGLDLMERLRASFEMELKPPILARALAFEFAGIAYLLAGRRRPSEREFTYHVRNSSTLLIGVFLFLIIVETIGIHTALSLWNGTLAWFATALSVYLALQLVVHSKAIHRRPVLVTEDQIRFRCGILGDAVMGFAEIETIELEPVGKPTGSADILPLGKMSQVNVRIKLRSEVAWYGIYGVERKASTFGFSLDDPEAFARTVEKGREALL